MFRLTKSLSRKLQTRGLWWLQTHRPWPVRRRILRMAPCPPEDAARTVLAVLATPATVIDAAWTARSFLTLSGMDLRLSLIIDAPEVPGSLREMWEGLFPGSEVHSSFESIEHFTREAPRLAAFALHHPLGRKLVSILSLQADSDLLYCDADVLCFRPTPELHHAVLAGSSPSYLQDVGQFNGDGPLLRRAAAEGLQPAANLNSGLLYLPQRTLDVRSADRLLDSPTSSWFVEQTIIALLMGKQNAQPLPADSYAVSMQGQFYPERDTLTGRVAVRHFVTPVRHLMYGIGMPLLLRTWEGLEHEGRGLEFGKTS